MRDRIDDLAERLTAAGVSATPEPQDVPVPGAWIAARRLTRERMCGGMALTVDVYLVVRDSGTLTALDELAGLIDKALTVIDPDDGRIDTDETVILPHDPTPLPAAKITTTID